MAVNHTPRPHTTRAGTTHGPGDPWQVQAACAGQDPETWVTPHAALDMGRGREALAVCESCPVLAQCRRWALLDVDNRRGHIVGGIPFAENGQATHRCNFCHRYVFVPHARWCETHLAHRDNAWRATREAAKAVAA